MTTRSAISVPARQIVRSSDDPDTIRTVEDAISALRSIVSKRGNSPDALKRLERRRPHAIRQGRQLPAPKAARFVLRCSKARIAA